MLKIIPSKSQIFGWIWLFLYSLFAVWQGWDWIGQLIAPLIWLIFVLLSAKRFLNQPVEISITRKAQNIVSTGKSFQMVLQIQSESDRDLELEIYDHHPAAFIVENMPVSLTLPAGERAKITYSLIAPERGEFKFAGVQVRYIDKWKYWHKNLLLPLAFTLRSFPVFDLKTVKTGFQSVSLPYLGQVHPLYIRSGSGDFDHLRDYRAGDPLNHLDHKASARLTKPVSREFVFEHEQPVCLLLDCSRRMNIESGHISLFDEALNAAMLLAQTAIGQGDEFGMAAFSTEFKRYQPTGRWAKQLVKLQQQFFDLVPDQNPPNFIATAEQFYKCQKRRSLLIWVTTLQDGDGIALQKALHLLKRKHHVLLISLRPPLLDQPLTVDSLEKAVFLGTRDDYANRFATMQKSLRSEKVWFIECRPAQLQVQLINGYLKYKKMLIS